MEVWQVILIWWFIVAIFLVANHMKYGK